MKDQFINIKLAMTKAKLNVSDVAGEMGITAQALYQKLGGRTQFNLSDMTQIRKILVKKTGENLTLDHLFGDADDS